MADYGSTGGGRSLRDALNAIMPLTGMGEYGAMFPPNAGAPQPNAPVPLPQPRPPMPPQGAMGLPPEQGLPPGVLPSGVQGGVPPQAVPLPTARPLGLGQPQPQSYTQRLGLGY